MNDTLSAHDKRIIKDRERRFKKANLQRKRVLIAKDVIRLVKEEKLVPQNMRYLEFDDKIERRLEKAKQGMDIREVIGVDPSCTACAVGGLFVSALLRNGGLTVEGKSDGLELFEYLEKFFSHKQLQMIESAFEAMPMGDEGPETRSAAEFGRDLEDRTSDDLLIAIMQNVIKNKGEFVP